MLNVKKDRLDYGKLLNPPEGFRLEHAVASTYSLDLTTLLSIPVALFYQKNMDGQVSEDRMDIFDAIQKSADTITIYCQKGKIKVPLQSNRLLSFIDDCVIEILPGTPNTSIHSKVWVIRYRNNRKNILYRVIILSRNLSFDRSWDIAFSIEGFVGKKKIEKSKPLADYIRHLRKNGNFKNSTRFINDLGNTSFSVDIPFTDFNFHPIGFSGYKNPLQNENWKDLLIVSPFLQRETLEVLAGKITGKKYLFSRREELDKIDLKTLSKFKTFALSRNVVDGENFESEDGEIPSDEYKEPSQSQNLHAKLYIGTDTKDVTKWYLGSANCSVPAWKRNEEFFVMLAGNKPKISFKSILDELLNKKKDAQYFEAYNRDQKDPVFSTEYDFRPDEYALLHYLNNPGNIKINCLPDDEEQEKFTISVKLKTTPIFNSRGIIYQLAPYGWNGNTIKVKTGRNLLFTKIPIYYLSPFFVWKVKHIKTKQEKEFLIKLPIKLPDNRCEEIIKSIIKNSERFMQLIQFLLGGGEGKELFKIPDNKKNSQRNDNKKSWFWDINMYEELLIAVSRDRGKLDEIGKLIKRLDKMGAGDLIPKDFTKMWNVFIQAMNHG